jgi:hypothetical protein
MKAMFDALDSGVKITLTKSRILGHINVECIKAKTEIFASCTEDALEQTITYMHGVLS